jgi:hypothetical protein
MRLACIFAAVFALRASAGQKELETRKPEAVVLPAPPLISVNPQDGGLVVRFRELGLERVVRYTVYAFRDGSWQPLGSSKGSPIRLESCEAGTRSYALAAIDHSETEGAKRRFTSDLDCRKGKH